MSVRIFIACHKESETIGGDILTPIHVGAALSEKRLGDMLRDDEGENISDKNRRYCELTAQYWAWKNSRDDYVGFVHYRRYFSFSEKEYPSDPYNNVWYDTVGEKLRRDFCLNDEAILSQVREYDIIVPRTMDLSVEGPDSDTVYTHYKNSLYHNIKDYDFCCDYIRAHYPAYVGAMERYNSSSEAYFLNMYVMRRDLFESYCEWLFPMLDAFDSQRDYTDSNIGELRTPGFLAERLFGVWFTHLLESEPGLRVRHAQVSMVQYTDKTEIVPAFGGDAVCVCLGADDRYAPFAGLVISSVAANASPSRNYDIVVFSNGIAPLKQDAILRSVRGYPNISVRFAEGAPYLTGTLVERGHINRSAYLRFIIPKAMRRYAKAVYIDCDLVVNRDIAELYDTDLGSCCLAAVRDTVDACWVKCCHNDTERNIRERLGIGYVYDYFNSGVLVMDIGKFNALFPTEMLFDLACSRQWLWQDQDVLNYLCRGRVLFLNQKWNVLAHDHARFTEMEEYSAPKWMYDEYMQARKDPYIIHYCGKRQPCFRPHVDLGEYFWQYARRSPFYEILLNYAAQECIPPMPPVYMPPQEGRCRRLLKKGLRSLKKNGVRITWEKTVNKFRTHRAAVRYREKEEKIRKQRERERLEQLSQHRAASLYLLQWLENRCKAAGGSFWLTELSLYGTVRAGGFWKEDTAVRAAMMRNSFEKLGGGDAAVEVFAESVSGGVARGVRLRALPQVALPIALYEETDADATYENWLAHCESRCGGRQASAGAAAGKSIVRCADDPASGYCEIFEKSVIFPLKTAEFAGKRVPVPAGSEKVLKTLYLGWEDLNSPEAPAAFSAEEEKLLQSLPDWKR